MPTISQQPIDIQRVVALASSTKYVGWYAALAAALTLSAANSNAPVQIAKVEEEVTAGIGTGNKIDLPGAGTPYYFVQLQSGTTYYPLAAARTQAYSLSASNSDAPTYIAKVIEVVTAP